MAHIQPDEVSMSHAAARRLQGVPVPSAVDPEDNIYEECLQAAIALCDPTLVVWPFEFESAIAAKDQQCQRWLRNRHGPGE